MNLSKAQIKSLTERYEKLAKKIKEDNQRLKDVLIRQRVEEVIDPINRGGLWIIGNKRPSIEDVVKALRNCSKIAREAKKKGKNSSRGRIRAGRSRG